MIVVADTSVVLNLCAVARVELVRQLFGVVMIPPEVAAEFHRLAALAPRFSGLKVPEWIAVIAPTTIPVAVATDADLDAGEIAALALAIEQNADAILLDETAGRRVARTLGLRTVGILGILLQAKSAGFVSEVAPILDDLQKMANFWVADALKDEILRLAGEKRS